MASKIGLVRSFYGWLVKTENDLKERKQAVPIQLLPSQRPTSLSAVTRLALRSARALKGTEFRERADYWSSLFQQIFTEGWKGDVFPVDEAGKQIREELEKARGLALQD